MGGSNISLMCGLMVLLSLMFSSDLFVLQDWVVACTDLHMPSCECRDCDYVHFVRSIGAPAAHMINCIYIVAEQSSCLHIVIHMLLGMTHSHTQNEGFGKIRIP